MCANKEPVSGQVLPPTVHLTLNHVFKESPVLQSTTTTAILPVQHVESSSFPTLSLIKSDCHQKAVAVLHDNTANNTISAEGSILDFSTDLLFDCFDAGFEFLDPFNIPSTNMPPPPMPLVTGSSIARFG